jgi:lipopolysaccharide export system protein LptC
MRWNYTRFLPIALMFALAMLTFYLDRAVREEERHPALKRHDPDYIVHNFTAVTFDSAGVAESMLSAQKMVHYPDDDSTELDAPRLVRTKPDEPRVTVRADRGTLSSEGQEIFLYDNVRLVREAGAGRPEARMSTSFLHVVQPRSLARTDRPVLLEEASRSLAGRGMEYNYGSGQLVLHADVRGRFEPGAAP